MSRRPVQDSDGNRYLLLKQSSESSLVRNPETGERLHLPNEALEPVEGKSTAATVLAPIPEAVQTLVTAVHDERSLALLVELDTEGPMAVRTLMSQYDFCESDLHGLLGELQAARLITEKEVVGERGYETTDLGSEALAAVQHS